MQSSRRQFVASTVATALAAAAVPGVAAQPTTQKQQPRPKLAVIATTYHPTSHAQHIVGRFLYGYTLHGKHHIPEQQVVSMYVAQRDRADMSERLSKRFGFKLCSSIREALVLDQDRLAVDAVLFVGEHGRYPQNELGQKMYPRHEFVKDIVAEFRRSGRSVPVFSDKHLSYSWEKALEMVAWSRELKFPLQAGSVLPLTWRCPQLDLALGTPLDEAVAVGYGDPDRYGFHAFETLQCHVERRQGGETGIRRVQMLRGDDAWQAVGELPPNSNMHLDEAPHAAQTRQLFRAALSRSYTRAIENADDLSGVPLAFRLEYRDGFRATIFLHERLVNDFTFAARITGQAKPVSTLHFLPSTPAVMAFGAVAWNCERMFSTGKAVIPVERTLLVSGALESLLQSQCRKSEWVETPHLNVAYQAFEDSGHFRGPIDPASQIDPRQTRDPS